MNKVYVIGMGPGAYEQMTVKAVRTLEKCDVIVGYTVYIELLKEYFPDKRYLTTSMRQEAARCRMAGRFTCLSEDPIVIVDGAHNEDAAKKLKTSIERYFTGEELIVFREISSDIYVFLI